MELAAVAARAGVSPGLPHRYFTSKSGLLVALVEAFFDELDDAVYRPIFEDVSDDWWERERARIGAMVDFFHDHPLGVVVVSELAGDADVVGAKAARIRAHVKGATKNIRTGKRLGRVPSHVDATLAGALLIGGVHQVVDHALTKDPPMPRRRVVRGLQELMRRVCCIEESP